MEEFSSSFNTTNGPKWCLQKKYKRYWSHYNSTRNWFLKHQDYTAYQNQTNSMLFNRSAYSNAYFASFWMFYYYSTMKYYQEKYYNLLHQKTDAVSVVQKSQNSSKNQTLSTHKRKKNRPHLKRKKSKKTMDREEAATGVTDIILDFDPNVLGQEEEVIECHMEITEEMLDFFAQSAKHRKERDARKQVEQNENIRDVYVDISRVNTGATRATTEAPKERPGTKRTTEMKLLYGKGAPMIHGMETALQLTFDKYLDLKQPKLWPHLPLNIKFD